MSSQENHDTSPITNSASPSVTVDIKHGDHNVQVQSNNQQINLTLTNFNCSTVTDFSPLCDCLYDKILNDYYQLLNLVLPVPKTHHFGFDDDDDFEHEEKQSKYNPWTDKCNREDRSYNHRVVEKIYKDVSETDRNLNIRLCKLTNTLMSFPGCNKDDYLFWRLCVLYGRRLKCGKEKMQSRPFCIDEPCIDYRALCKISTILSAIQQEPDTNITYDTGLEMITLLFKTLCADTIPNIGNIMLLILIAVNGCNALNIDGVGCDPSSQIFSNSPPTGDPPVAAGSQNFPCGNCTNQPFTVYVTNQFVLDANVVSLLSRLKIMGFLMFLIFEYFCDFTITDCLCVNQIIPAVGEGTGSYIMCCQPQPLSCCATNPCDPATATPNLWPYQPAPCPPPPTCSPPCIAPTQPPCPIPPVCAVPTLGANQVMYGVNSLGNCLITLLKRLYCAFTQSVCNSPCPDILFEYLLKYSPEYNNNVKQSLCLRPLVLHCYEKRCEKREHDKN